MAKYSIEETTLTAIGDALRRKHGETKIGTVIEEIEVPAVVVAKTPNATGFDSFEGSYYDGLELDEYNWCQNTIHILNAAKIKIKVSLDLVYKDNSNYDELVICSGKSWSPSKIILNTWKSGTEECEAEGEYVTFTLKCNRNLTSSDRNLLGFYAECSGYDADGNPLGYQTIQVEKETELPNTYSSAEMAQAIDDIKVGAVLPEEAFFITGSCDYRFAYSGWDWYLNLFKGQIISNNITSATYMFFENKLNTFPFEINFADGGCSVKYMFNASNFDSIPSIDFKQTKDHKGVNGLFDGCKAREIGTIKNLYPSEMGSMFQRCQNLRYLPDFENLNLDRIRTYANSSNTNLFNYCHSLREISESFLKELYCPVCTGYYYSFLYSTFNYCYSLDEIRGLNPQTGKLTSNAFSSTFNNCYRLKDMIFATQEDGTPYVVNWSKQTIDLSTLVGYANTNKKQIYSYNSGITADKEVVTQEDYERLKSDPDWFTADIAYSRYNKESAINTINSLPDASAGTGNIIKFKGAAGSATDGGAIQDMDETIIALAASRGWTVTFA